MKRKIPVFHNNHTIQKALSDIDGGLTLAATARKYGVHYSTAYSWTQRNKKKTILTDTKTNTVNGTLTDTTVQPIGKITVELEEVSLLRLEEICKHEVRTLEQQVKYLILEGMTRRNPIPF
tara:strand:- start:136 stop:498 length:363 start_codon:yes stop_codon:yes gene_type:complete